MNKLLSLCPQGQKLKTSLAVHETATIPPLCLRGASAGPTLVVTTGMHDCEFVRAEDDRLLFRRAGSGGAARQPDRAAIGQSLGILRRSQAGDAAGRQKPEPFFPGSPDGTLSQQLAYVVEQQIYPGVDFLIDLHGGDINEDLTPLVLFPAAAQPEVSARSRGAACRLPAPYRVRSSAKNSLYGWAAQRGMPTILLELGVLGRWTPELIRRCRESLHNLMDFLGMTSVRRRSTLHSAKAGAPSTTNRPPTVSGSQRSKLAMLSLPARVSARSAT